MGHDHAGHSHGVDATSNPRWLWVALGLNFAFMVVEVVVGLIANSVALLSDAAHMLTDTASLGLALGAITLAARPPSGSFTFGLKRSEILSAQLNGASLLVLAAWLGFEAVGRLSDPPAVEGGLVIVVGVLGALVNLAAAMSIARANRTNLNVEGAYLHNLADLWSSVAAVAAGVVIVTTGFDQADGIAALTVCALMLWGGFGLIRDSGRILLEGAPKGMEPDEIGRALAAQPGIVEVHDLHVWEVTSGFPALSAHVLVAAGDDCHARRRQLQRVLEERFGIEHTTLQVDHERERQLIELEESGPSWT
ncbi:MAG TPA: cation diffusion facilitator family transporter [Thermoleophilaceae bacterium]|nr:cation diffusion facilitator family transporter [Thermoleophilaceae bacterium]